jgi:hypothetical protein
VVAAAARLRLARGALGGGGRRGLARAAAASAECCAWRPVALVAAPLFRLTPRGNFQFIGPVA